MAGSVASAPDWLETRADEYVLLRASPSQNLVLASLILGVLAMMGMAVVVGFFTGVRTGRRVSFAVLVLVVVLLAGAFVVTKRREYVLTSQRVCSGVGLGDRRVTAYPLEQIHDVTIEQSGWQQLFNVGTIRFVSADGGVAFRLVENPAGLQRQVLQFVDIST